MFPRTAPLFSGKAVAAFVYTKACEPKRPPTSLAGILRRVGGREGGRGG